MYLWCHRLAYLLCLKFHSVVCFCVFVFLRFYIFIYDQQGLALTALSPFPPNVLVSLAIASLSAAPRLQHCMACQPVARSVLSGHACPSLKRHLRQAVANVERPTWLLAKNFHKNEAKHILVYESCAVAHMPTTIKRATGQVGNARILKISPLSPQKFYL